MYFDPLFITDHPHESLDLKSDTVGGDSDISLQSGEECAGLCAQPEHEGHRHGRSAAAGEHSPLHQTFPSPPF